MIGETENEGVEVGHIARYLECMNLPTAVRQQFVAAGKTAQDERAVIGRTTFPYNVIMARYLPAGPDNGPECLDLVRCKGPTGLQSFDQEMIDLRRSMKSGA